MIQDLCFTGKYKDTDLTIEVILVNPMDYDSDDNILLFSLQIRTAADIDPNRFTFYITGKQNHLYNAESVTRIDTSGSGSATTMLVAYIFRPEFLYNNIKLGFLYKPYNRVEFIEIRH